MTCKSRTITFQMLRCITNKSKLFAPLGCLPRRTIKHLDSVLEESAKTQASYVLQKGYKSTSLTLCLTHALQKSGPKISTTLIEWSVKGNVLNLYFLPSIVSSRENHYKKVFCHSPKGKLVQLQWSGEFVLKSINWTDL